MVMSKKATNPPPPPPTHTLKNADLCLNQGKLSLNV